MRELLAIAPVTTSQALERVLEDRILDGELAPGTHLREQELAAGYEVARHSLRAACDALVRRGLLTKRVNRGFFVPELTLRDAHEIFDLRRALESPVVRDLAARREVPAATRAALAAFDALPAGSAWRDVVRADVAFHTGLVQAAGNSRLARAHGDLMAEVTLCIAHTGPSYEQPGEVAAEHHRLVATIESGDPDAAAAELAWHFDEGLARLPFPPERR